LQVIKGKNENLEHARLESFFNSTKLTRHLFANLIKLLEDIFQILTFHNKFLKSFKDTKSLLNDLLQKIVLSENDLKNKNVEYNFSTEPQLQNDLKVFNFTNELENDQKFLLNGFSDLQFDLNQVVPLETTITKNSRLNQQLENNTSFGNHTNLIITDNSSVPAVPGILPTFNLSPFNTINSKVTEKTYKFNIPTDLKNEHSSLINCNKERAVKKNYKNKDFLKNFKLTDFNYFNLSNLNQNNNNNSNSKNNLRLKNNKKNLGLKIKKKSRPNFCENTIAILTKWLYDNKNNPYPDPTVKQTLCDQTGITMLSLNNWFVNARRRYIQNGKESKKIQKVKSTYANI
ncbi:hypothetical protein HDU92_006521, partial [Lobulomyces angularis]